jgi:hypothetical protein
MKCYKSLALYYTKWQNVFQNPELFGTQVSLSPEQSTLDEHALPYKNGVLKLILFFIVCEILGHFLNCLGQQNTKASYSTFGKLSASKKLKSRKNVISL